MPRLKFTDAGARLVEEAGDDVLLVLPGGHDYELRPSDQGTALVRRATPERIAAKASGETWGGGDSASALDATRKRADNDALRAQLRDMNRANADFWRRQAS